MFSTGYNFFSVYIKSVGCDDEGKVEGTCGFAYIQVNSQEHSKKKRGHNIVVVDPDTGIISVRQFSLVVCSEIEKITVQVAHILVRLSGTKKESVIIFCSFITLSLYNAYISYFFDPCSNAHLYIFNFLFRIILLTGTIPVEFQSNF